MTYFTFSTQARFRNTGPSLVDSTQVPPPPPTDNKTSCWKLALKGIQPAGAGWEDSLARTNHRGLRRDPEGCDRSSLRFRTTPNFSAASLAVVSVERARGRKDTVCCVHWRSEKSEWPKWSSPSFWWKTAPFSGSRKKWRGSPSSVPLPCPWSSSSTLVSVHSRTLRVGFFFPQPPSLQLERHLNKSRRLSVLTADLNVRDCSKDAQSGKLGGGRLWYFFELLCMIV